MQRPASSMRANFSEKRAGDSATGSGSLSVMMWLIRFVLSILTLLLKWGLRITYELVGCAVRLFYWSVQRYGWGRVGAFVAAFWASVWAHRSLGWLDLSIETLGSIILGTLGLWGSLMALSLWITHSWHHRRTYPWPVHQASPLPVATQPSTIQALASAQPPRIATASLVGAERGGAIWEQAIHPTTLQQAWQRVLARGGAPGPDGRTVETFTLDAERHLGRLTLELRTGAYKPGPPRWREIPKDHGGVRRLAILSVRDRIVQHALYQTLAPQWNQRLAPCSYAYRPGHSALQAVTAVEKELGNGRLWVMRADIEAFFDRVPHFPLFTLLEEWLLDAQARRLLQACVTAVSPEPGRGLAQGAPLSPLLANVYLHRFDAALLQAGHTVIRYADDLAVLCPTRQHAESVLQVSRRLLQELGLSLNAEKSRIVHRDEGFTFLGYTFTREGKRPSQGGLENLQARLAATPDDATRRQILVGWQGYFGSACSSPSVLTTDPPEDASDVNDPERTTPQRLGWDTAERESSPPPSGGNGSNLAIYRQRFVGRADVFARHWQKNGRRGYTPVHRSVTDEELSAYLAGSEILGTYLLGGDGTIRALVLDVDGPDCSEGSRALAFQVAQRLVTAFHRRGIDPLWVDSGGKGYHLWLCFAQALHARAARQSVGEWLEQFRPFPEGVLVEIFPKQDSLGPNALGALIRLPFGRHPEVNRWSRLLTDDGQVAANPWTTLAEAAWVDEQTFLQKAPWDSMSVPEPPETIAPVVGGCSLIRALVKKAAETHNLRHTERLALLYSVGHLGEAGQNYVHQVIGRCANYDPRLTDRWIRRVEEGHKPLRCGTLKAWMKDFLPGVRCDCTVGKANSSPVELLRRARRPSPSSSAHPDPAQGWDEVAEDLFGDALSERRENPS